MLHNSRKPQVEQIHLLLAFTLLLATSPLLADDTRPPQINRALSAYEDSVSSAKSELQDRLEKEADATQRKGDLARFKEIAKEREAFESSGKPPTVVSAATYQRKVTIARRVLIGAYESTIKALTQTGDIKQAETMQTELTAFMSGKVALDSVRPQTVWQGICEQSGKKYPVTMYVVERHGDQLKVAFTFPTAPALEVAVGKATDSQIVLETTVPLGQAFLQCTYTLRYSGKNKVKGRWHGKNKKGKQDGGSIELTKLVSAVGK